MRFFWKNTHTSIASWISNIFLNIYRRKGEKQWGKWTMVYSLWFIVFLFTVYHLPSTTYAIYDPLSVPNNKFGIHIIHATPDESLPAADLVNSSGGDWGYVTVLVESKDRSQEKWQEFFNDLRIKHLIPIVRLATQPEGEVWKRPYEGEEQAWADFLDNLIWPTKNRYIIIYNEPNHSTEWGGIVDAKNYAEVLDKTITALKNKNRDFFVLNAGLDASAPSQPPQYLDQLVFLRQMEEAVPGILDRLDGWVSHSYPNPDFSGSPDSTGRGTVGTWAWEQQILKQLGVTKNLPIFITETGWKHAEGINYNPDFPSTEWVSRYFKKAFETSWAGSQIVAVTPFLLNYQQTPFDHFSFKKIKSAEFYPQYLTIKELPKVNGRPVQENLAQLTKGEIYSSLVEGEQYNIALTFKNIGQSIWGEYGTIKLIATQGATQLGIGTIELHPGLRVEPGQEYTFNLKLTSPRSGNYEVKLNLFVNEKEFQNPPFNFSTEVKSPVILKIKATLKWKENMAGEYILKTIGAIGESVQIITLNNSGESAEIEARHLLPDYAFDFTLSRAHYFPVTVRQTVYPGVNTIDFSLLNPDILSVIIQPVQLWKISPFSS